MVAIGDETRECARASEIACKREIFRFSECDRGGSFAQEMSGPSTKMYALPPINILPPFSPSEVVYKLPNILINPDKPDGSHVVEADIDAKMPDDVVTEQKPLQDYSALEARQEKVLDQLAKLKNHVQTLCHFLKQSDRQVDSTKICAPLQKSEKRQEIDLIVYVSPYKLPYSILALKKLWKNTAIKVQSFVHSSVDGTLPFFISSNPTQVANNVINITLIWKKVDRLEFVIDLSSYPIIGEVNLLRYLSRKIDAYNYERDIGLHDNHILDLCYRLSGIEKFTGPMSELDELDRIVSASEMLRSGSLPRIPAIAVWSTIKQLFSNNPLINKLPKSIKEVYKICEETFVDNDLMHNSK